MSKDKISMKLLIDKSKHKVLFAEAGKECVDFLFHILSLPLGSVIGFLSKESMSDPGVKNFYLSYGCCFNYVSDVPGVKCPSCPSQMSKEEAAKKIGESSGGGGYVEGVVTYMIMDDLSVQPMSNISSITLLSKFNIQDVGCLEEKIVSLDMNMGLSLLKASLASKSVLTDVFLPKRAASGFQLKKWRWLKVLLIWILFCSVGSLANLSS